MPLPLTVSCFSKIQIGFTFLVPAHPGSPGERAVKRVCVCVCVLLLPAYRAHLNSVANNATPEKMARQFFATEIFLLKALALMFIVSRC